MNDFITISNIGTLNPASSRRVNRDLGSPANMADYDRRQSGGYNNRKRRYRGMLP